MARDEDDGDKNCDAATPVRAVWGEKDSRGAALLASKARAEYDAKRIEIAELLHSAADTATFGYSYYQAAETEVVDKLEAQLHSLLHLLPGLRKAARAAAILNPNR